MPWQRIRANDGLFDVNWDGVHTIIRSWAWSLAMIQRARKNTQKATFGPDIVTVEVDWKGVREHTDKLTASVFQKAQLAARATLSPLAVDLKHKVYQTAHNRQFVTDLMSSAHDETMKNVEASVHKGELGVKVATDIRNLAAATLLFVGGIGEIAGAGFLAMSAEGAVGVGGMGAALKGISTYQDEGKGHAGHAAAVFTANLVGVAIPLAQTKAAAKIADEGVKLFVNLCFVKLDAVTAGITSFVEGGHVDTALATGASHLAVNTHGEIVRQILESSPRLEKAVVPAQVIFKLLETGGDKAAEKLTEEKKPPKPPAPPPKNSTREHQLMDSAVVDSHLVEKLAIRRAR
jgi:hypothetical protein